MRPPRREISFPGGRACAEDEDSWPRRCARRTRSWGSRRSRSRCWASREPVHTRVSGFTVFPFVGLLAERPEFIPPARRRYAEVIEIMRNLLAIEDEREWEMEGERYQSYAYVTRGIRYGEPRRGS